MNFQVLSATDSAPLNLYPMHSLILKAEKHNSKSPNLY
ncbi:hypothetical protein DOT_1972 [Desulfosporosinus sp. OT]|nr:hypothetical protein DOT_1972 [Desulfosporosinus sp. OT]